MSGTKIILPQFKDDTDRLITLAMIISSVFFVFIPSLIVVFLPKQYISESTYEIAKAFFNFELFMFLISLFCMIPIIGWLVGIIAIPVMELINIVVVIINLCALANNKEIKVPGVYQFL